MCAPGGTRTPDDCSEDSNDIHFTTGALRCSLLLFTLKLNQNFFLLLKLFWPVATSMVDPQYINMAFSYSIGDKIG